MTNPPFDEQPATVAQSSEFLTQWPSLVPAIQRLVEAKLREQIGADTQGPPEVSQAARDTELEIRMIVNGLKCWEEPIQILVQRAMDASATAAAESKAAPIMEGVGVEIARLTKELAKCHGQPGSSDPSKIGHLGLIAMLRSQRDKARTELAEERESWIRMGVSETMARKRNVFEYIKQHEQQLAAAQSDLAEEREKRVSDGCDYVNSLAEKEKEVERWREDSIRQAGALNRCALAAEDRNKVDAAREALHQEALSTETQNVELWFALQGAEREAAALRAQLQQAEATDNYQSFKELADTLILTQQKLQQAEQERDEARMDYKGQRASEEAAVCELNEALARLSTLRAELAAMEKRCEAAEEGLRGCCLVLGFDPSDGEGTSPDEVVSFVRDAMEAEKLSFKSLETELAAAQETVRRVEQELQWARATLADERTVSGINKLIDERDALQKQNADLQTTVSTLAGHIKSGQQRANDSARNFRQAEVKRREAEARNAELVKALRLIESGNPGWNFNQK